MQIMVSEKSDIPITPDIVKYNVNRLRKKGADVYIFQGGFHHSKIMMIDSLYCFVGSANLNSRSLSFDYECNLLIADQPTTRELQRIFERDKQRKCYRMTAETWRGLSRWHRFRCWLFHFLIPFV